MKITRLNLDLTQELIDKLDRLKEKYGQNTRSAVIRNLIALEREE